MQPYEIMLMLDPELEEERQDEIIARIREHVEGAGGTWESLDAWGRRKLAYEIDHKPDALYWVIAFSATPAALAEISRVLRITEGVLRHMATIRPAPAAESATKTQPAAAGA